MGVYINMEMPQKTYAHCMLIKDIDGSAQLLVCTKNSGEISEWESYDLVPVPPHGRLIDADALIDSFDPSDFWNPDAEDNCFAAIHVVNTAPTIIPAEEATDGEQS